MKIGDIDVPASIVDLEHRVGVLEDLLQYILDNNRNITCPTQGQYEAMKDKHIQKLQVKYPHMGITKRQ